MGVPSPFRQGVVIARASELFDRRFDAYGRLHSLTDYGPENQPLNLTPAERRDRAHRLTAWFYEDGAGLLLSGRAFGQFRKARETLLAEDASSLDVRNDLSKLRTDLKIDLGVRQPQERDVTIAWPEEERW